MCNPKPELFSRSSSGLWKLSEGLSVIHPQNCELLVKNSVVSVFRFAIPKKNHMKIYSLIFTLLLWSAGTQISSAQTTGASGSGTTPTAGGGARAKGAAAVTTDPAVRSGVQSGVQTIPQLPANGSGTLNSSLPSPGFGAGITPADPARNPAQGNAGTAAPVDPLTGKAIGVQPQEIGIGAGNPEIIGSGTARIGPDGAATTPVLPRGSGLIGGPGTGPAPVGSGVARDFTVPAGGVVVDPSGTAMPRNTNNLGRATNNRGVIPAETAFDRAFNQRLRSALIVGGGGVTSETVKGVLVSSSNGSVTLNGTVANESERQLIESRLRSVIGVRSINNQIQIRQNTTNPSLSPGSTGVTAPLLRP